MKNFLIGLSLAISLLTPCLAEPEGRYLLQKPNGEYTGEALEVGDSAVKFHGKSGMESLEGEILSREPSLKVRIGENEYLIREIGDGKVVVDPLNLSRLLLGEKVEPAPEWLQGTWVDDQGVEQFRIGPYGISGENDFLTPFRLSKTQDSLAQIQFFDRREDSTQNFLRISYTELLSWNERGAKLSLTRTAGMLNYSTPQGLWQVMRLAIETESPDLFLSCFHPSESDYENTKREVHQPNRFKQYCQYRGSSILNRELKDVKRQGQKAVLTFSSEAGDETDKEAVLKDGRWYLVGL